MFPTCFRHCPVENTIYAVLNLTLVLGPDHNSNNLKNLVLPLYIHVHEIEQLWY